MGEETLETRATPPGPPEGGSGVREAARKRIGTYEIRRIIASGGMGTVYEAWQQTPRRAVALKVMKIGLSSHSARERFEREAQVLARLHHPGIVQVYDSGTHVDGEESTPFIAMEFVVGAQTLVQYAKEKALTPRQIVELLVQICEAVQHGNEKGIIHRDLKPSNLLVDADGRVKVIDFGVARALDNDESPLTLQTQVGQLVGTVHYMSPEQIDGDSRTLDARTDVYSLGVVLYELLAHRLPHSLEGKSLAEASRIVKEDAATTLHDAAPRIDDELETIVMKAIAKERGSRYASVRDLRDDLSRWLAGEEITARRQGPMTLAMHRAQRWSARNRFASTLAIIVIASTAAWLFAQQVAFRLPSVLPLTERLEIRIPTNVVEKFDRVRAVILNKDDGTITAEDDAAAAHIEGVSNKDKRSWRLLQAALVKRLVQSGAKVIAFDVHFPGSDARSDALMLESFDAAARANVPLVLHRPLWPNSADTKVEGLNPILNDPRIVVAPGVGAPPRNGQIENVILANQRDPWNPWPAFSLATWAAGELGRTPIQYLYDREDQVIDVTSHAPSTFAIGNVIRKIRVPVTSIQSVVEADLDTNTQKADFEAVQDLCPVTDEALAAATLTMKSALTLSDAELRDAVGGRIVVIGDAAQDGKIEFKNKVKARGYAAHMVIIETLSGAPIPRVANFSQSVLAVLTASALGLLAIAGTRRFCATLPGSIVLLLSISESAGLTIGLCYLAGAIGGIIVHPLCPTLAALFATALTWTLRPSPIGGSS